MKFSFILWILAFSPGFKTEKSRVHIVRIEGMRFVPSAITIKKGDKVLWINNSGSWHNVVASDKSFSGDLSGENSTSYEHAFEQTGTFNYFCRPHKMMGMKGKIVVVD